MGADRDGFEPPEDCDDTDPDIHPEVREAECGVQMDLNCDGRITKDGNPAMESWGMITCYDGDGDGWAIDDCWSFYPLYCDEPPPGYTVSPVYGSGYQGQMIVDCDDSDDSVHPGATELCNGVDDDCDGETDEGCF